MPFTLAHTAVAIPWASRLHRRSMLSALVIGSIVPDFAYFMPLDVSRAETHRLSGIVWFSMPLGLLIWWLFHAFVKRSVTILLPDPLYARVHSLSQPQWRHGTKQWLAAAIAVWVGAATHIAWDSFTHRGSPLVQAWPLLSKDLIEVLGLELCVYKFLQHFSTIVGSLVVIAYVANWFRVTPKPHGCPPSPLRECYRYLALAVLALLPMVVGLFVGWNSNADLLSFRWMRQFIGKAVIGSMTTCLWMVVALSIILAIYERAILIRGARVD